MVGFASRFVKQGFQAPARPLTPLPVQEAVCPGPFPARVQRGPSEAARCASTKGPGTSPTPHPFLDWQKPAMLDCRVTSAFVFVLPVPVHIDIQACVGLWRSWERA